MTRERVLECTRRGVVGLSGATHDADQRGDHNKEIDGILQRHGVEIPRSLDFGAQSRVEVVECHLGEEGVFEHHGALDQARIGGKFCCLWCSSILVGARGSDMSHEW